MLTPLASNTAPYFPLNAAGAAAAANPRPTAAGPPSPTGCLVPTPTPELPRLSRAEWPSLSSAEWQSLFLQDVTVRFRTVGRLEELASLMT